MEQLKEGDVIWIQATVVWEYKTAGMYDIEVGNHVISVYEEEVKIKRDNDKETEK